MFVLYVSYDPSTLLVTQYLCKGVTFGRHWFETTDVLLVILFDICVILNRMRWSNIKFDTSKYPQASPQVNVIMNFGLHQEASSFYIVSVSMNN